MQPALLTGDVSRTAKKGDFLRGTSPAPDSSEALPGSTAALGLPPIARPRGPNQLVCRGIKTVHEVIMARETGLFGYSPIQNYKGGCGGKLDRAQVKLHSQLS